MTRFAPVLSIALVIAALGLSAPARADGQPLSEADAAAIRSVIDDQIAAFRRDDGAAAYAHAAPSIRRLFPSADRFMEMVRSGYGAVYRPRSYDFGESRAAAGGAEQLVTITGPDGGGWLALYTFERQADGSWKISGVLLHRQAGVTI